MAEGTQNHLKVVLISPLFYWMEYDKCQTFHDRSHLRSQWEHFSWFNWMWIILLLLPFRHCMLPVVSLLVPLSRAWLSSAKSVLLFWIYAPSRFLWVKSLSWKKHALVLFCGFTEGKWGKLFFSHWRRKILALPNKQSTHIKENSKSNCSRKISYNWANMYSFNTLCGN